MEGRAFGIGGKMIAVEQVGSLFEHFLDVGQVVSLDVPIEVLPGGVAVRYALQRSHN